MPSPPAAPQAIPAAPQAGVFVPSQAGDIKPSTLVPSTLGAAGPAPVTMGALPPMATETVALPQFTDTAVATNAVKNQSDLLANIQKIIHNELLANRATDTSVHQKDSTANSPSLSQGREHQQRPSGVGHAAGCNGEPCTCDQSQYIKKDSIPCWGCALDY